MSWILQRGVSVKESVKQLANDIAEQCGIKTEPQKYVISAFFNVVLTHVM